MNTFKIKVYADGADKNSMLELYKDPAISGLTTNPTLMRKAGISNYASFAQDILLTIKNKPLSLEVFSDEFDEMYRQALIISGWQENVFVKIPITNSRGESAQPLIKTLSDEGVKLNVTAILTLAQVENTLASLNPNTSAVISVFAGRIADTGRNPENIIRAAKAAISKLPKVELLWASVREVLNIFQADKCGCDIVTVPPDILKKAELLAGKDLTELSLDTVKMFERDAKAAGYQI